MLINGTFPATDVFTQAPAFAVPSAGVCPTPPIRVALPAVKLLDTAVFASVRPTILTLRAPAPVAVYEVKFNLTHEVTNVVTALWPSVVHVPDIAAAVQETLSREVSRVMVQPEGR